MCAALVQNSLLYLFDLSPVSLESEEVVYSEIHVYKRRRRGWSRRSNRSPRFPDVDVSVNVYELTRSSLVQRTSLTVTRRSAGWQTLNVTDVVRACVDALTDGRESPTMIAVSFADMVRVSYLKQLQHSESAVKQWIDLFFSIFNILFNDHGLRTRRNHISMSTQVDH